MPARPALAILFILVWLASTEVHTGVKDDPFRFVGRDAATRD
jgi:hypothetical protein